MTAVQIYKIVHVDDPSETPVYIGRSNCYKRRFKEHRYNSRHPNRHHHRCDVYQHINANGGIEMYRPVLIENATSERDEVLRNHRTILNMVVPLG